VASLTGSRLESPAVVEAVNAASTGLDAMSDLHASAAYRRRVAITLCIRALEQARKEASAKPAKAAR
jgi:CO/xanthine dehydrogenase FAD-binding subunit